MFDVQSMSSDAVLVNSLDFRHTGTKLSTVKIYTSGGSYINIATSPEEWTLENTTDITIDGKKGGYATIVFQVPIGINPGSNRAFYIESTGKLISGHHEQGVDETAMDNTLSINPQARIVGTPFGGGIEGTL